MSWLVFGLCVISGVWNVVLFALYAAKRQEVQFRERDVEYYKGIWREACEQRARLQDACTIAEAQAEDRAMRLSDALGEIERITYNKKQLSRHSAKLSEEVSNLRKELERLQQRRPSNKELDEYRKEARGHIAKQLGVSLAGFVRIIAGNQWIIEGSEELRDAIESVSETACRINDEEEYT